MKSLMIPVYAQGEHPTDIAFLQLPGDERVHDLIQACRRVARIAEEKVFAEIGGVYCVEVFYYGALAWAAKHESSVELSDEPQIVENTMGELGLDLSEDKYDCPMVDIKPDGVIFFGYIKHTDVRVSSDHVDLSLLEDLCK